MNLTYTNTLKYKHKHLFNTKNITNQYTKLKKGKSENETVS